MMSPMSELSFVAQTAVVLAAIVAGVRTGGVGIGLWGAVGAAILTFGFGLPLGSPPVDALLIIVAVIVTTSTMQAAGGTDWMVYIAARIIARRPRMITVVAPVTSLALAALAGTSNIVFSLLPVIEETARRTGIRPVRALAMSVVATSIALAASPVSAAMAAMITVMEASPTNWSLVQILAITCPTALIGTIIAAVIVDLIHRLGEHKHTPAIEDDHDSTTPHTLLESLRIRITRRGRNTALIYLAGVAATVALALSPTLRPSGHDGEPISVASLIQLAMLATGAVIAVVGRPTMKEIPGTSVFQGGMVAAIAFMGLAWMIDTFLQAHAQTIGDVLADSVGRWPWVLTLAVFGVAFLTTSQSTATRMIMPFGFTAGIPAPLVVGLWTGSLGGIYLLPTNGLQITAVELDSTGSTKLGTKLVDNSFFVPSLILTVVTSLVGAGIAISVIALS